ncbi:MAG: hypothetical protein C0398_02830 [Coprothermobacter sp.]|nr:hypothetical protein [Coprothermobacter sp.]
MTRESFVALVGNAALLLALVYVYDLLNVVRWISGTWIRQVIAGIAIGANGIFVMLMPWTFVPGINFDTRSVLLAISGLFFGTIPTVVAVLMTAAFRLIQGGGGAWTGVSVIVASGVIGVAWRLARRRQLTSLSFRTLYALGLVVHAVMLALMFTLPLSTALRVLGSIAFPVLVIYPIATAECGMLMVDRLRREQAAVAVRESESQFRALSEQAAIGVTKTETATGKYVFVNQRFADIVGYAREELLTMSFHDLTDPHDLTEDLNNVDLLVAGKIHEYSMEKRYLRKDGTAVSVNLTVSPLWNPGEPPLHLIGLVEDITERKQAEAQLRQSQKMEAIGELAGGVAHDFNNLLTGILGNIALMRSSLPPTDPLLENLNAAETAARQAADLTKGLLTFGRRAVVSAVPLDMAEAVDTTLVMLKQSLPATIDIVRDVEPTTWSVLADRSQIVQVILNLAVNARDAMQSKGTLTIRTRNEVLGQEYVQKHPLARPGEFVHLSVADTGPGIPDEIREHLFEPFHTTKPTGSGTGLGLSIVYGAVKQAGGWVTADSPPPEDVCSIRGVPQAAGTVFDIFLPRCLDDPSTAAVPARSAVNVCSGTILVVEDEPVVSAVAQALLTRSGCAVLTAGDGASALATFREHPGTVDLILLDMTMPGMTTDDIVQAIRDIDAHVPVLLTSGYTSGDTVKRMLDEGTVQGFLTKPYELRELLSTINRLLQRS